MLVIVIHLTLDKLTMNMKYIAKTTNKLNIAIYLSVAIAKIARVFCVLTV